MSETLDPAVRRSPIAPRFSGGVGPRWPDAGWIDQRSAVPQTWRADMTDPSKKQVDGQDLEGVVGGTFALREKPYQIEAESKEKQQLSDEQLADLSGAGDPKGSRASPRRRRRVHGRIRVPASVEPSRPDHEHIHRRRPQARRVHPAGWTRPFSCLGAHVTPRPHRAHRRVNTRGGTRTPNPRFRRPMLYPIQLTGSRPSSS